MHLHAALMLPRLCRHFAVAERRHALRRVRAAACRFALLPLYADAAYASDDAGFRRLPP